MATYTQEAKRLVLVASAYDPINSAAAALADGTVGFKAANGADILVDVQTTNPDRIQIQLATADTQFGATNSLDLISEIIEKDMVVSATNKVYAAPYEMAQVLRLGGGTYDLGEEVVLSVYFDKMGSLSYNNTYAKHGAYLVPANSTSAATVAAALVTNLEKNLNKDGVPRAKASVGGTDVATQVGTTIDLVAGDVVQDLTGAGTNASDVAGWALLDGELYYITGASGGSSVTLNRPAVTTAAAEAVTNLTTADIIIEADAQTRLDFNNPWIQTTFNSTLTVDGEVDANLSSTVSHGASKGSGYGPEVALIEEFAQGQQSNHQWMDYRRMKDRRLNTDVTKNYDTVSIKLETTKKGSGSNITSVREIQVFIETGASEPAANFLADLNAWIAA